MEPSRVTELHYIAPIDSLASIGEHGLQSHNRAKNLPHRSVASEAVQERRVTTRVPQGLPLHDYVNLYFDARNPMMSRLRGENPSLVVVRVGSAVLEIPGTVITDGNAASAATRYYAAPGGIAALDEEFIYAEWWTDADPYTYYEKKRKRCAEVLVPHEVSVDYIFGCFTFDQPRAKECEALVNGIPIEVNRHVFF